MHMYICIYLYEPRSIEAEIEDIEHRRRTRVAWPRSYTAYFGAKFECQTFAWPL